jgi:hypothetical protein
MITFILIDFGLIETKKQCNCKNINFGGTGKYQSYEQKKSLKLNNTTDFCCLGKSLIEIIDENISKIQLNEKIFNLIVSLTNDNYNNRNVIEFLKILNIN